MRFRDVSDERGIEERAEDTLGTAGALRALGFETVGYVEDRLERGRRKVYEVQRSPDGRAFALPESFFGRPHIVLRTLLEDGTIIETSYDLRGGIRLLPRPRVHHPAAGYHLRRAPHDPERLWDAHRRHVEEVARARRSQAATHDDVALYGAMGERATWQLQVRRVVGAVFAGVVMIAVISLSASGGPLSRIPSWAAALVFVGVVWPVLLVNPGRWVPLPRLSRHELLRRYAT